MKRVPGISEYLVTGETKTATLRMTNGEKGPRFEIEVAPTVHSTDSTHEADGAKPVQPLVADSTGIRMGDGGRKTRFVISLGHEGPVGSPSRVDRQLVISVYQGCLSVAQTQAKSNGSVTPVGAWQAVAGTRTVDYIESVSSPWER